MSEIKQGDLVTHPQFRGVVCRVVEYPLRERTWVPYTYDADVCDHCGKGALDAALGDECPNCGVGEMIVTEVESDEGEWDVRPDETRAVIVMVGDDSRHTVEIEEITLHEGEVCSCGQIGCGWG